MIPAELEVALHHGLGVFPCRSNEKRPLTEHGVKDASTDRVRIVEWSRQHPGSNWAAAMTAEIAAVDVDMKNGHDGLRSLRTLTDPRGGLPPTLTNNTPSGGEHRFFRFGTALKNKVAVAEGIDIRSEGGYTIVPPSTIDGRPYKYSDPQAVIARAPDWFVELLRERAGKRPTATSPRLAQSDDGTIPTGQRNDTLFRYASSLRGRNISESEAWALLRAKNDQCDAPLDERELQQILRGAWHYAATELTLLSMELDVRELLTDLRDDEIVLPNDYVTFPWAARRLYERMALRREMYVRNGVVLELKGRQLEVMSATKFRSRIDDKGRRVKAVKAVRHSLVLAPKRCSADTAEALLATREAAECLPAIELATSAPVLIERAGELVTLGPGYHAESGGVLVLGGAAPERVPLETATKALTSLLDDFLCTAAADWSRAIAGFIGPAMRSGALLPGHALVNCIEADASQTGKGYLVALQQAVYGEVPKAIAQRKGGVGSFDEDLGSVLLKAQLFALIDNARERITSEYFESIVTSEDEVLVRVPHRGQLSVSVRRMMFQLTSNGLVATTDLSNRMLITRLCHQPVGYRFKNFPEGGLLQHVRARQSFYLGCVHAVLRRWHKAGRPQLETDHSFGAWVGALDWIVQRLFGLPPLLEGHDGAVERVANPALGWLRSVGLAAVSNGREGHALSASALIQVCVDHDVEILGAAAKMSPDEVKMHVGQLLGRCFRDADELTLDAVHVKRWLFASDDSRYPDRKRRLYQFWRGDEPPPPPEMRGSYGDGM